MTENKTLLAITAMICITILQIVNMLTVKIDQSIMVLIISVISLYAGYNIGKIKIEIKPELEEKQ